LFNGVLDFASKNKVKTLRHSPLVAGESQLILDILWATGDNGCAATARPSDHKFSKDPSLRKLNS
jgi:hypothetical protein